MNNHELSEVVEAVKTLKERVAELERLTSMIKDPDAPPADVLEDGRAYD